MPSRRGLAVCVAAAVVLLAVLPTVYATPAPTPTSLVGGSTTASSEFPVAYSAPFAERAGFADWYATAVEAPTPAAGSLLVVVTFAVNDPAFFAPPANGDHPLTTTQVADRFGPSPGTYHAAIAYFVAEGLSVVHTWPDRLSLTLDGSAPAVGRAFGTAILSGNYLGRPVTFPARPPTLPANIEPAVSSVLGLSSGFDEFSVPLSTPAPVRAATGPAQGGDPVMPGDARQIYGLSDLYNRTTVGAGSTFASGQGIAVLLWGDGYNPSDIATFYSSYYPSTFPAPTITPEPVDGAPMPSASSLNDPDTHATQELTLDLEWSGSMAPGATLYPVYAPEGPGPSYSPSASSMADALHEAVTLPVDAVSMSFGTPESTDSSLVAAWSTYLAEGAQEGITLLAATGDLGGDANANCGGGPSPSYPAVDPSVLAVGGTSVALQRNVLGQVTGFTESGWSDSGGGFSRQYGIPYWQDSVAAITAGGGRGTPDVSATADTNFIYYAGLQQDASGTSFATPLWAGMLVEMDALHHATFGSLAPRLYSVGPLGRGLNDITGGANCVASAGSGWDAVTGWGSPSAFELYEALTATYVNLDLSVTPTAIAPGGSVSIDAHLANATTDAAIPNVPIEVTLVADENFGPCTGTFGSSTPSTDANGDVAISLSVPVCYLGSRAVVDVLVVSDGYYGHNSTTIPVNLLALIPALAPLAVYPLSIGGFLLILGVASAIGGILGAPPRRRAAASGPPPVATPSPEPVPAPEPVPSPPSHEPGSPDASSPSPSTESGFDGVH